jgi:hypothetical protein
MCEKLRVSTVLNERGNSPTSLQIIAEVLELPSNICIKAICMYQRKQDPAQITYNLVSPIPINYSFNDQTTFIANHLSRHSFYFK